MFDLSRLRAVRSRKSMALILSGALLIVGGLVLIVHKATSSDAPDPISLASADRVLQSVQVTMSPTGAVTAVDGSVVGTTTDKKRFTGTSTYSPRTAAADLPVRVLTSYRTATRSGTDLSDLDGYTGPVQIQLTVQNLTVKPQTLTYDVDGTSQRRTALVGAPLTVVASTALPGVSPGDVRRSAGDHLAATDGVLSQGQKGLTQVQWAAVLAPPQLPSSTTLTLAVNAHDFTVPDINLSVEPGIVTDASVGALIDQAFNPSGSDQMQLEQRTIDLVGQVNTVLAQAGATIADVRSTLDDSAKTLGTKTISDLKSSASGITASVQGLDQSVASLGQDISTSLKSTRSTTLEQLQQMVQGVDQLLGDTTATAPVARVSGSGCQTTVPGVHQSASVYGNLLEVVSQLDGYARSTGACKQALRTSILSSVGPSQPDAVSCLNASSVTCALFDAGTGFRQVADDLTQDGATAVASLHPEVATNAVASAQALAAATAEVVAATTAVSQAGPSGGHGADVSGVRQALQDAINAAGGVDQAIQDVHTAALAGQSGESSMGSLNSDLAAHICALASSGDITSAAANDLRAYVASSTCPDTNGATTPLGGAPGGRASMDQQIAAQTQAWSDLAAATTTGGATDQALSSLQTSLTGVGTAIDALAAASGQDNGDLHTLVGTLQDKVATLGTSTADVTQQVDAVKTQQDGLSALITQAFNQAADDTRANAAAAVDPQIRQITDQAGSDSAALGAMLDRSQAGLDAAAGAITANGAKAIDAQRRAFASRQQTAGAQTSAAIDAGLAYVTRGVSSSTRDLAAANTLLSQDLESVLLDLGTRQVKGSGLLGSMTTGAATADTAAFQLALASRTASQYASVRRDDVAGLLLRQAQTEAAATMEAALPAFRLRLPQSATHRTVYTFLVRGDG